MCSKKFQIHGLMNTYNERHGGQRGTYQEIWIQLQYAYRRAVRPRPIFLSVKDVFLVIKYDIMINSQAGGSPDMAIRSVIQCSGLDLDRFPKTAKKYPLLNLIFNFLKRFRKAEIQY